MAKDDHSSFEQWLQQTAAAASVSGYRLYSDGDKALEARLASLHAAQQWVAIQTYIWTDDDSGRQVMSELLQLAERGLDIYLLIDDMDVRSNDYALALLDQHPNINIRLFNPFRYRSTIVHSAVEVLFRGSELNHRMHNKAWIVDGHFALVGGRNIGNAYFGRDSAQSFSDLDAAIVGHEVENISSSFWRYWEHPLAYPIEQLRRVQKAAKLWERHPLWQQLVKGKKLKRLKQDVETTKQQTQFNELTHTEHYHWTGNAQFVADDGNKVMLGSSYGPGVLEAILFRFARVKQRLIIISPYFVPGEKGTDLLCDLANRGVNVHVLTNSLASNDAIFAHSGYAKHRVALLRAGIQLYEMKVEQKKKIGISSSRASLHSKAMIFDDHESFVGSFNLDPRSATINTEHGVFIDDAGFSAELLRYFEDSTAPQNAYRLRLEQRTVVWRGEQTEYHHDPKASLLRRLAAWFAELLPIESQL